MKDFDAKCAQIAELTDQNAHGEALVVACDILGAPALKVKKMIEHVNAICDLEGSLPSGLSEYRYGLYQRVMQIAKMKMTESGFEKFYGSF